MSDLYYEDFVEGLESVLHKMGNEHLFTSPNNASLFPTLTSQAKWKFAKGDDFLRLHDGQKVYAFHLPTGTSNEETFEAHRLDDVEPSSFADGAKQQGLAQIHRADPGSIYFTLQEGQTNPTYTFRHMGEANWRGTPKARKVKAETILGVHVPALMDGVKAAFELRKEGFSPLKWLAGPGAHGLQRALMSPGEGAFHIADRGANPLLGMAGMAGIGAGAGALYHLGRRTLYNTPEENAEEDEQGMKPLLRRMAVPALGLGGVSGLQASLFNNHYNDLASGAGVASSLF